MQDARSLGEWRSGVDLPAPHLAVLAVMPEAWPVLFLVLAGALFPGWARIESGSILGPWMLHATANVSTALLVATH